MHALIRDRGLRHWLPAYVAASRQRQRLRAARAHHLTHLLFLICDHFEPRHGVQNEAQPAARLKAWKEGYKALQEDCFARHGLRPLHTWFYPPHHGAEHLPMLARMAFEGLGEVELHYHHDGDTAETLRTALRLALDRFHRAGLLLQLGSPPQRRFGFIHGDWALDNAAHGRFCGVNGELSILKGLGCWADLTMPSADECQTRKINSIYYAVDDPSRSKSHDRGTDARVGRVERCGLLLIQGPLGVDFNGGKLLRIENANLTSENWGTPARVRAWIDSHVHVRGRPEWLFVKLHTHGALECNFDALFGERARRMHATLAERYNDGRRFRLHYVTARQAFNLIRAAERGESGDPQAFLDAELPPQVTSLYWASAPHELRCCLPGRLVLSDFEPGAAPVIELRHTGFARLAGDISGVQIADRVATVRLTTRGEPARLSVSLAPGAQVRAIEGCVQYEAEPGGLRIEGSGDVRLELMAERSSMG